MTLERYAPAGMLNPVTDSWTLVVEQVAVLATRIADTELVPAALRGKPAAVTAVILYGREIGLGPMQALRTSYVVNGRVALAAETMRGLVLAAGHEIVYREATTARCVAAGRRQGTETWHEVEWTIDLARKANINNQTWARYPRQMLKARATAELCRDLFPDVIGGFVAREELDDPEPPTGTGINVSGDIDPKQVAKTVRRMTRGVPADPAPATHPPGPAGQAGQDTTTPEASATPGPPPPPLPGEDGYDQIGQPQTPAPGMSQPMTSPPEPAPDERGRTADWAITKPQLTKLWTALSAINVTERELGLYLVSLIVNHEVESTKTLTRAEGALVIDTVELIANTEILSEAMRNVTTADDPLAELDKLAATFLTPPPPA